MQTTPQLRILVVDDHEAVLGGTLSALREEFPTADIRTAMTAQAVIAQLNETLPDVLVVDLALPKGVGDKPKVATGIHLLRTLMETYTDLNIVVQSTHTQSLRRLKPTIDAYQGGFTMADKNDPLTEMLTKVNWALKGVVYTPPEMRNGLEFRPEWLEVLRLAFQEGLQDKAIAKRMNVAERTVRYYWNKVHNILEVYPEEGKNIRIQTEIRAREAGLID